MEVVVISEEAALVGEVVADVIHMLAELIENAAVFSPPPTGAISGERRGPTDSRWRSIDRGLGMSRPNGTRSTCGCQSRRNSTWPSATSSACSWSPGLPHDTESGFPSAVGVRRGERHRPDPALAGRPRRGGDQGRRVPAGRDQPAGQDGQARHLQRARAHRPGRRAARPGREPASPARPRPARPGGGHRPARGVGTGPGLAGDHPGQLRREHRLPVRRHRLPAGRHRLTGPTRPTTGPTPRTTGPTAPTTAAGVSRRGNHRPPDRVHAPAPGGGQRARQRRPGHGRRDSRG